MRTALLLTTLLSPAALIAQAPAPAPSLGDRVKAERPAIEKLMAELKYPEALARAEALLPQTEKPAFDKTTNQTLVQSSTIYLDLSQANRLAVEAADAAGAWEKALTHAKTAQALAQETYETVKEPFGQMAEYYTQSTLRAKQVLDENAARIKELKGKTTLDAGERQELDLALTVEKEVVDNPKWSKFFQTYIDVAKRDSETCTPLVRVMEDKLKGEADQVAEYKAGQGDRLKWVEAVVSTPAYLDRFSDKAGKAQWLYRLATLDPENKKVQRQLDILNGKIPAAPAKKGKKG